MQRLENVRAQELERKVAHELSDSMFMCVMLPIKHQHV